MPEKNKTMEEVYQEAKDSGRLGDSMLVRDQATGKFTPAYFKVRPEKPKS